MSEDARFDREVTSREDADNMALLFLRDYGPHTMGPLKDDGAIAAALCFLDLEKRGLVDRVNFGGGYLQFSLTDEGARRLEQDEAA